MFFFRQYHFFFALLFITFGVSGAPPVYANTPELSFKTSTGAPEVGEHVSVSVFMDPHGTKISGIEGAIAYTPEYLRVRNITTAHSFITVWVEMPEEKRTGVIRFSGIVPGGFSGVLKPFEPGVHPGELFTVVFTVSGAGHATLATRDIRAILHSEAGEDIPLPAVDTAFQTSPQSDPSPEALVEPVPLTKDNIAPATFTPVIARDEDVLNGAWFVAFNTHDAESGISHYEVAEKKGLETEDYTRLKWRRAESPYVLTDQARRSFVYVKAVDNSGNITVGVLSPQSGISAHVRFGLWGILGIIGLLCAVIVYRRLRRDIFFV